MKKVLAIAFACLFTVQLLNTSLITWYFEVNREYIAEVLCVNKERPITICGGQCVLKNWLNEASPDQQDALLVEFQQPQYLFHSFAYTVVKAPAITPAVAPYTTPIYTSPYFQPAPQPPQLG